MIPGSFGIAEAVERMQLGQLSPRALVEACLSRIEQFEPRVHAWVLVDAERALQQARQLESEAPRQAATMPLFGIPVGIKDIIDVQGMPTRGAWSGGSSHPATQDAPAVALLRRAGAIILGKTVTTQLACFDPPPTRNPWNLQQTPGGSSSGSAVAVALGMCLAALGSQTGGSITRPASFCGICGLKPRFEAVCRDGVLPISEYLDHVGPMAPRISDLARVWQALRPDHDYAATAREPSSPAAPLVDEQLPTLAVVEQCRPLSDPSVAAGFDDAVRRFREAGADFTTIDLPPLFDVALQMHRRIMAVGMATTYGPAHRKDPASFGPSVKTLIDEAGRLTAVEFSEALRFQTTFRQEIARRIPPQATLVSPSTVTTAPGLDTTGDPRFNSPWSLAGNPTCTVPIGLAGDGMPMGLQLISNCDEGALLARAAWCERILGFQQRPELLTE